MKIRYNCDYCEKEAFTRPSHYKRKKRHFCSMDCYSLYRKHKLAKEEQHAYKGGGCQKMKKEKGEKPEATLIMQ